MKYFARDLQRFLECNRIKNTSLNRFFAVLVFPALQFILSYRIRCWFARHGLGFLEIIMLRIEELIFGSQILRYYGVQIGPGLYLTHPFGITIGGATIGENFTISKNCTIGAKLPVGAKGVGPMDWHSKERVVLGDWVFMGAGSCILGPVTIGDNVIIGANSVVVSDIPSNVMVAGVPARIIKKLDSTKDAE